MKNEIANVNWIGKWVAVLSFIIGTLFFGVYFIFEMHDIILSAFYYVVIAAVINTIILIALVIEVLKDKENRQKYLETMAIILMNIPIVALYLFFVFNF